MTNEHQEYLDNMIIAFLKGYDNVLSYHKAIKIARKMRESYGVVVHATDVLERAEKLKASAKRDRGTLVRAALSKYLVPIYYEGRQADIPEIIDEKELEQLAERLNRKLLYPTTVDMLKSEYKKLRKNYKNLQRRDSIRKVIQKKLEEIDKLDALPEPLPKSQIDRGGIFMLIFVGVISLALLVLILMIIGVYFE